MSPIIKEPDGNEQIPADTESAITPFPEDINIPPNPAIYDGATGNASKVNVQDKQRSSKPECNSDKRKVISSTKFVHQVKSPEKSSDVKLKRSQSMKSTRAAPYDHQNGSKGSILQTKSPQSKEYESASSITKQTKSGKFKMFKNRWSMFPKCSSQETETRELHNLRRSQSMRIPSRSSHTISSLMSISECPSQLNLEKKQQSKSITKYDIKNSKSMNDIRHYAKKESIFNKNNNIVKINENITEDQSKNDIDEAPKNFAHKTIDVIRKSVQSRLKEKQSKKKQEKQDKETKEVTGNSNSKSNSSDEVMLRKSSKNGTTASKDVIKSNSKRKKNDMNDDSEFKPKKKVSLIEKEKLKSMTIDKNAKENNGNYFSNNKAQSKEINKKEIGNENSKINDKNYLKMNNKRNIKENKNNSRSTNKKEQMDNVDGIKNNDMISYQYGNNIICYPDKIPARSQPSYAIQSHHVLFLNNIHETLSNSYKSKTDTSTFQDFHPVEKPKNIDLFPNLNKTPAKLRSSLPLLSDESFRLQDADESAQPSSLMRSCSAECVNEKILSVLDQEIKTKSASPMSISNCDEEIPKVDDTQSSLSFNCGYDPYIDETMEEYLCEGEGESHFGSLFTENKSTWKNFSENFKLELDFNSGSYYFEGIGDGAFGANFAYKNSNILNNFVSNNLSLNYEENDTVPIIDETPKSLPLNNEIKIYDSRKRPDVQFCSLQNSDFTLRSQSSLETTVTTKEKCDAPAKKQKYFSNDRMSESKRLQTAFGRVKDNAENATKRTEIKIPKKKWESKLPLNESKENRKVVKNIPRASPVLPNRSKKLKESFKRTNAVTNTLPNLTRNDKVQKSMSENLIANKHEKEEPFRKEKSNIESLKEGTKPQGTRGVERGRTTSLIFLCNNEGKILRNHDTKIEDEKKCQDLFVGTSRRAKIDNSKATLAKAFRGATGRAKQADPVKILRPTAPNGQTPSQIPSHISDQLKKLEAELCARTQEAQSAKEEVSRANRGLEALTVLVHYLTKEYNAFATPKLRAEVEQLRSQLTDVRLCLDESTAAARRLELEAEERCQKHEEVVKNLEETHSNKIANIILEHQKKLGEVLEKHNEELREIINSEEFKFETLIKSHNEELERIDEEWREELDKQHKRHLHALEQLNSCHTQQLRDTEESWRHREQTLQENNARLLKEQDALKQQAKKLEETLLSDKDHRLQAARRVCTALQNEVDSLKTVVDMRNSEVHKLRDQLADKERLSEELDCAKDRVRSLQAKTEDLHAQMETKLQLERQLLSDRHALSDSLQREASINKRLSLENEELQWKLRQRETNPNAAHSTSTLDLVTRCSSSVARQQEGGKTGVLSPQFTPRSQRIGIKPHDKKWSQSITNIPEDAGKFLRRVELQQDVTIESPPPSPRVKAVIEKSNSVSFILDLNDTFPDEPFLTQSYHHSVKPRTPILQRKQLSKSFSHSLEKSRSTSLVQGSSNGSLHRDHRDVSSQPSKDRINGINKEKVNGDLTSANCENGSGKRPSKYRTHSTSESSDSGDIERISPTGLSWTVPVHSNLKRYSKHIPANRFQLVPEPPRLLQQPDEDEYEENENEFVEVLALGDDINSAPLTMLFGQTPSTSVSLSDSDVSQCGSRADLSSEDDDDDDGTLLQKESQSRPQEGAGEAMIFPDVFDLKKNGETCKNISKSQISSAPSSDSEDANQATNAEEPLNMSWSEDVECDLTSSSEMQEL